MRRIDRVDGFLPIADHGVVGDGATAALLGRDGSVAWLCAPRFDSPPLFCPILDADRGGRFAIAPGEVREGTQRYAGESGILISEVRGDSGHIRITDALALTARADLAEDASAARGELLREVEALSDTVSLVVDVVARAGAFVGSGRTLRLRTDERAHADATLQSSHDLTGGRTALTLRRGERLRLVLRWGAGSRRRSIEGFDERMDETAFAWRRWAGRIRYEGPQAEMVRRSAITLKLLDHFENGAIVASPTSSLPEWPGGSRNWDYRYAWIRDAAFSVYAMRRVGLTNEAWGFLGWVLDAVERHGRPRVLYTLDGDEVAEEVTDGALRGYLGSRPVRWGNSATLQRQHDVYGEILDCAWQWAAGGAEIDPQLWERLVPLVDAAAREWREPDHGIWEVRTPGRPFTYSAALCHVALDRGTRLAERVGLPGDVVRWTAERDRIAETILSDAWDDEIGAITEHLHHPAGLDASVLALPLRRVLPAEHPKMVATCEAISRRLGAGDGLLYRYDPKESSDGIDEDEGAFLLCSFWLVDNLAAQSRIDEAVALFESLCGRVNHLGLLPEQIDPSSGRFLGNFPQALSHVGLISSAVWLARRIDHRRDEAETRIESA